MGKISSERVERADNAKRSFVQDMGVELRGRYIAMAEPFLHDTDIGPRLQEMRREAMAHDVRRHASRHPRGIRCSFHGALHANLVQMMPSPMAAARVGGVAVGREHELPAPFVGPPAARPDACAPALGVLSERERAAPCCPCREP